MRIANILKNYSIDYSSYIFKISGISWFKYIKILV